MTNILVILRSFVPLFLVCSTLALSGCLASRPTEDATEETAAEEEIGVGYGTQLHSHSTGSEDVLLPEDLDFNRPVRIEELLQGRVAGVYVSGTPTGTMSVRIRGASSLMGSTEPLYVLDGLPLSGPPPRIAPRDVASIVVLKGAEASIYGHRSANGVILITTKRGR